MAKAIDTTSDEPPKTPHASGEFADVYLFGEAMEEFDALEPRNDEMSLRKYRSISRYIQRFADKGPSSLNEKMFKKQLRMRSGGSDVMIWEFKAHQFRIYGVICDFNGKRCFLGTACDPDKQRDKADHKRLQKAADEYVRIING